MQVLNILLLLQGVEDEIRPLALLLQECEHAVEVLAEFGLNGIWFDVEWIESLLLNVQNFVAHRDVELSSLADLTLNVDAPAHLLD